MNVPSLSPLQSTMAINSLAFHLRVAALQHRADGEDAKEQGNAALAAGFAQSAVDCERMAYALDGIECVTVWPAHLTVHYEPSMPPEKDYPDREARGRAALEFLAEARQEAVAKAA